MPSLLIHLAIAKRYAELHPGKILNQNEFEKGSIAPDLDDNFSRILSDTEKATSHFRIKPDDDAVDFNKFINDENVDLSNNYWKGYYLHLLTDHLFYKTANIVKQCLAVRNGECKYLNYAKLRDFIEKISASDN